MCGVCMRMWDGHGGVVAFLQVPCLAQAMPFVTWPRRRLESEKSAQRLREKGRRR